MKSRGDNLSENRCSYRLPSNGKPLEDGCENGDRSTLPSSHLEYTQYGGRAHPVDHHDNAQKPLHKDKFVETSIWSKLLHPEQRHVKRCRPSADRFDAPIIRDTRPVIDANAEKWKLQAVEEGIGPLHITEDRPIRAEMVDEHDGNVHLRVKRRLDSVGTDYLKEIERQLEVIEQGQLASLHLDPADEDPRLAAVIPRRDGANSGEAVFHRGEPVRSSVGGLAGTSNKSRPRSGSDNAGHSSPDDVTMPSRRGFGRTPVRRQSRSPTASPMPRRAPPSDNVMKTGNCNHVSLEVCFLIPINVTGRIFDKHEIFANAGAFRCI